MAETIESLRLNDDKIRQFFLDHLDRIYCAKTHMVESFPEIAGHAHFSDIRLAIFETIDDVRKQISRMDEIYRLMNDVCTKTGCTGLVSMLAEAVTAIGKLSNDVLLRDMAILFYLQNIESIEVTSFQILQMIAERLNNSEISQLLKENFDEAKDDRTLLRMITSKYID